MADDKEKAMKLIAKQIKQLDENDILLKNAGVRSETQQARLLLFDALSKNGYLLNGLTYKITKKK